MKEMYEGPRITAQEPRTLLAEYKPGDDKMEQTEVLRPKRIDIFGNVIPAETLETWEPNPFLKPHAEGGRIGYDDGQLVRPTVDGSRPGYATSTVKKGKFKYPITNQHGTIYSDKKPKKYAHEVGSGKFNMAERNRVTRIKFPEYNSYSDLLKKDPAKAKNVMAALQHSSIRGTKITKKTVFTPLTEIQQNKILLEFPDAVFYKGQKFGFNSISDQTKFVQVKKFIKRGYKPRFKQLPLKVKNELKEKFSHFKDWDFKKFKYGVPDTLNNVENRRLMQKVKTYINDPKPWKFGFSLEQKGAWMTAQMYRAWEHGNTDYEPIYNKNNKVIGMKEGGKTFYANENVAPSKKATLINSHSEFNNIQKFVDVANEAKLPLKDLKGYKNTKALLALFPEGYEKIKFSDLTNYLYREAGADVTRNAIEKHHLKSLSDIGSATDAKNLQLLRQDLNTLGNTVAEQIKQGDFSRVADLEKAGVKITVDGTTYGKGFQDPRRQMSKLIGETTKKIQSLDEKKFAQMISDLCPKKASGGRIGYANPAGLVNDGVTCGLNVIKNKNIKTEAQARTMLKIAEAGSKSRALRGMLGIWGLGGEAIIEAGIGAYKVLGQGVPADIAWSESYWSYLDPRKYTGELSDLRKKDLEKGNPRIAKYFDALGVLEKRDYHSKWVNQMNPNDPNYEYHRNKLNQYNEVMNSFYGGPSGITKMLERVQPEVDEAEAIQAGRWAADAMPSTEVQAERKQKQAMKELMESKGVKTMPYTEDGKPVYKIDKVAIDEDLKMLGDYMGFGWTPYGLGYGMQQKKPGIGDMKYNEDLGYKELIEAIADSEARDRIAEAGGISKMATGGLANLTRTVAPDSGPMSQGLRSLYINDKDY
jgi:hypothetical protein